jgi:hypothetical protein
MSTENHSTDRVSAGTATWADDPVATRRRRGARSDHRGEQRNVAGETTNERFADQYRELVGDSENLAQETRGLQTALRADLAERRQ